MFKSTYVILVLHIIFTTSNAQLENLGDLIQSHVQNSISSFSNKLHLDIANSLAPLHDLGNKIRAQVETSLLPVKAIELKHKMLNGIGGTTVVILNSKALIIKDGVSYQCLGYIPSNEPRCVGPQEVFTIKSKEDFCLSRNYAHINNYYCIGSNNNGNVMFSSVNNNYKCVSGDTESQPLFISANDFMQMCGTSRPGEGLYKYYANRYDSMHVQIPNNNPYIQCLNNEPGVCVFNGAL